MALPPLQEQGGEEEQQEEGEVQCSPQVSREEGAVPPSGQSGEVQFRPQVSRGRCSDALMLVEGAAAPPKGK